MYGSTYTTLVFFKMSQITNIPETQKNATVKRKSAQSYAENSNLKVIRKEM